MAPVTASALRVSFFVSLYSGANVAAASGPYVDHPMMYSQTMTSANWWNPLPGSP